ncbi:MAG: hypothetical protein JSW34_07790 [Candidatus Zixiibacteriota bacterium]|nr:MAG: hypothetical protein JSW34_07790 [candidate division Zixibacteria bacterium]
MPFKFSRCFAMEHPQHEKLIDFYTDVIGLKAVQSGSPQVELDTPPVRLFVDKGERQALIFELLVPDLNMARKELEDNGCEIVRWEGRGKTCYVRDPFGFLFNVWEDPEAFATE